VLRRHNDISPRPLSTAYLGGVIPSLPSLPGRKCESLKSRVPQEQRSTILGDIFVDRFLSGSIIVDLDPAINHDANFTASEYTWNPSLLDLDQDAHH
jgi:hypothetical protein